MTNRTEKTQDQITKAKETIKALFLNQCKSGYQTTFFKDSQVAACGQFLNAKEKIQRGIHGTAAAINVLTKYASDPEIASIVKRLVEYIEHRDNYENSVEFHINCTDQSHAFFLCWFVKM